MSSTEAGVHRHQQTATTPIAGTFANRADGSIVTVSGNHLQASYESSNGNDPRLTVVR